MRSTRLVGAVLVGATWMGFHSPMALAATAWSTNAAACVPVSAAGVSIAAGAVTAKAGTTVTLYCAVTQGALTGGFDSIEITYKGGVSVVSGGGGSTRAAAGPQFGGLVTPSSSKCRRQAAPRRSGAGSSLLVRPVSRPKATSAVTPTSTLTTASITCASF